MIAVELKNEGLEAEYYFGDGNRVLVYPLVGMVMIYKYNTKRKTLHIRDIKILSKLLSRLEKLFNNQRN